MTYYVKNNIVILFWLSMLYKIFEKVIIFQNTQIKIKI